MHRWYRPAAAALTIALVAAGATRARQALAAADADGPRAPLHLADTGLYLKDRPGEIDPRNRWFSPQYPLWTDGAAKTRWIYLPPGTTIDATDPREWRLPVGTKLWKEFAFNGRKTETRLLWKAAADRWVFASYAWNEDGTDAILAPADGLRGVAEVAPGKRHSIPGTADCQACHGSKRPGPLGFNLLQLSTDRDPNAIHGEPLAPGMLTLKTLHDEGLLSPRRPELVANPPRIPTRSADTRAVLGYLSSNCGTCHNRSGEIAALVPSLRYSDLLDEGDVIAQSLAGRLTTWQVPGKSEGTVVIDHAAPDLSALLFRMRSRSPASQMPPLGTVLRDQEAVDKIARWIASGR